MNRSSLAKLAGAAVVCVALASSCGTGGESAESAGSFARIAWTYASPPPESSQTAVARWDATALSEQASVAGATVTLRKQGLLVSGDERVRFTLPGEFEADRFRQVRLVCASARAASVRVLFYRDGSPVWVAPEPANLASTGSELRLARVALDLPVPPHRGTRYDALELAFVGKCSALLVHSIELHDEPLVLRLPRADEPRRVRIGGDERHGFGLSSATRLEAPLAVEPETRFSLAFGLPDSVARPEGRVGLRIALHENGELLEERGFLARDAWQQQSFSLDEWRGRELTLSLAVDAADDGTEQVCAIAEAAVVRAASPTEAAPTVLLITSDTHRADHLFAARRGVEVSTPHLDALAAQGVLFEDCFSTTNVTNPSHIAMMTATHPRDHGIFDNYTRLSQRAPTLAEAFRDAGWRTWAAVSTRHLTHEGSGLGQGFDRFALPTGRKPSGDRALGSLLEWLPDADGQPLFCWLHLFDAHAPYEPPEAFASMYYPADRDPYDPAQPEPERPPGYPDKMMAGLRDLDFPRTQYMAEVSFLDDLLGQLFAQKRMARAVVAFTADHGESLGEHDVWWNHAELYTSTVHVPLILRWPGGPRGMRVPAPVRQLDLGRTLLDLAGAEADFPGTSFVDQLEAGTSAPRFSIAAHAASAAVTLEGWHLILWLKRTQIGTGPERVRHAVELYDLSADPHCANDRVTAETERARRMRTLLIRWLSERRDLDWTTQTIASAEALEDLAALGYTGGDEGGTGDASVDEACDCEPCATWR